MKQINGKLLKSAPGLKIVSMYTNPCINRIFNSTEQLATMHGVISEECGFNEKTTYESCDVCGALEQIMSDKRKSLPKTGGDSSTAVEAMNDEVVSSLKTVLDGFSNQLVSMKSFMETRLDEIEKSCRKEN